MEIEEAIEHAKEVARKEGACDKCRTEHAQLAMWLKELVRLRKVVTNLKDRADELEQRLKEQEQRLNEPNTLARRCLELLRELEGVL